MKLFEKKPNVKEQMRSSQREIGRGVRDLEREILALKREETRLIAEIKKSAKQGNTASTRILAKSLVRVRGQQTKMHAGIAQMQGVKSSMTTAAATSTVGHSMESAGKAMAGMNAVNDPRKIQQTMQQFAKQNAQMDMASEMMDDAIDGAMDDDMLEDETDDVVNQVLDDIGVDLSGKMTAAPRTKLGQHQAAPSHAAEEDDDLTARLGALR
ncbi:hypothetical protein WJX73_006903 [Symbiochloris irregularis]|uniref:Uncharacterized protein n=1 Tax=Symbiochloris irregularis TaxID=706552 RepID=A0AAW1PTP5_9CHLO